MRPLIPLLLTACAWQPVLPVSRPANACEAGAFGPADHLAQVRVDNGTRQALVWFPPGPGPHDIVVDLHEFRSNAKTEVRYSGWVRNVPDSNAILVAPDARYAVWNAGECCGRSVDKYINDVQALDALIAEVERVGCSSGRVLATGIGNGGMMAQMWACESDVPDAVVSVGGALQWPECRNKRPIPLLHYHGDADTFIPMDATPTGLAAQEGIKRTVPEALELWKARNKAQPGTTIDDGALSCQAWPGAASTAFCTVKDGKDTWPGSANGPVASEHPLADATRGAWAWVQAEWGPVATP
jgi:polyhydroxybutyrate depolymerase